MLPDGSFAESNKSTSQREGTGTCKQALMDGRRMHPRNLQPKYLWQAGTKAPANRRKNPCQVGQASMDEKRGEPAKARDSRAALLLTIEESDKY